MSALILAPDHDPFAFLNGNEDYRTAAKGLCVPLRNTLKTALYPRDSLRDLRLVTRQTQYTTPPWSANRRRLNSPHEHHCARTHVISPYRSQPCSPYGLLAVRGSVDVRGGFYCRLPVWHTQSNPQCHGQPPLVTGFFILRLWDIFCLAVGQRPNLGHENLGDHSG